MFGRLVGFLAAVVTAAPWLNTPVAAEEVDSPALYKIKPSEIKIPEGVAIGSYRRITQPFENWILICDENLQDKKKICNISQTIVDRNDRIVFSWSMAARADGIPFMIMRVPAAVGAGGKIALRFGARVKSLEVTVGSCNDVVCVGMVPVGAILKKQIKEEATAQISYSAALSGKVTVSAPLQGLGVALSTLK